MSVVLVHEKDGYSLKNNGVVLQGVTDVVRTEEDGVPVVKVKAELKRKEYVTATGSEMVLVVGPDGESLRHGDQFIEGAAGVKEKDGVIEFSLEVGSEDYSPKRAAKKAAPKAAVKPVVAPKKVEEKPEA
jgi:hypothetical protein